MSLDADIPRLMLHFEKKLVSLHKSNKPVLFASYSKHPGKDKQDGILPEHNFMHLDSDDLQEQADSQKFL
ncbi:MAG: hypothetical protein ACJARN_002010 [Arenicella sp.]|jgi:hypothetical protein